MIYRYVIHGTARNRTTGRAITWETSGTVEADPGEFLTVPAMALKDSMEKLLGRRTMADCGGPYQVTKMLVEVQTN